MNKTTSWIVGIIFVIALVGFGYYWMNEESSSTSGTNSNTSGQNSGTNTNGTNGGTNGGNGGGTNTSATGKVNVSFTDATTNIKGVSEVSFGVNKVELYSQTKGWITVSDKASQYALLDLHAKGQVKTYATIDAPADTYTKSRITLGDVVVQKTSGAHVIATVPNKVLEMRGGAKVQAGKTSILKVDVLADKSLHQTLKGDFVFTPVLKIEGRSGVTLSVSSGDMVTMTGGTLDDYNSLGMDIDGSLKANFELSGSVNLDIGTDGAIKIVGSSAL